MQGFDINELLFKFRYPFVFLLLGIILIVFGVVIFKSGILEPQTKIEILNGTSQNPEGGDITVEIAGAVIKPGVYKLPVSARVEDLLVSGGGFSADADRVWTDKFLNRAARLTDGQKIFIPSGDQQSNTLSANSGGGYQTISSENLSDSKPLININTASLATLDSLPGIGQVYGQNIIEHRPYSNTEELLSRGVLKKNVYEKIKDRVSVY